MRESFSVGASISILLVLTTYMLTEIKKIMATLEELKASEQSQNEKLNAIELELKEVTRKVNILIVQGSTGGGGEALDQKTIDDIAELQKTVDAQIVKVTDDLAALEQKVDENLGPHVEPSEGKTDPTKAKIMY